MNGVLPNLKENKPSEDVMNFFNKKTHGMLAIQKKFSNKSEFEEYALSHHDQPTTIQKDGQLQITNNASSRQNLNSGRIKEKTKEDEERERIEEKMRMTDFAQKLTELKDRIEVYEKLFLTRQPKFLLKTVGANRRKSQISSEKTSPKDGNEIHNQMPHKRPTRAPRLSQMNIGNKSMLNFPEIGLSSKEENQNSGLRIKKHAESATIEQLRKQSTQLTPKNMANLQLVVTSIETIGSKNSRKASSELPQVEIKEEENYQEDDNHMSGVGHKKNKLSHYAIQHEKDKLAKEELSKNIYVKKLQHKENAQVIEIKRRQNQPDKGQQVKTLSRDINSKSTPSLKYSFNNLTAQNNNNHHFNINYNLQIHSNNFFLPKVAKDKPQTSPRIEGRQNINQSKINSSKINESKSKKKFLKKSHHQHQSSGQFVKLEISQDQIKPIIKETYVISYNKSGKSKIADQHQQLILNRPGAGASGARKLEKDKVNHSPKYYITGISQNHLEKVYMKKNESFVNFNTGKEHSSVKKKLKKDRSITNTIIENVLKDTNTNRTQVPPITNPTHDNISVKKTKSQNQLTVFKQNKILSSSVVSQLNNSKQNINEKSKTFYNENEKPEGKKISQIHKEEEMRNSFSPIKSQQKLQTLVETYSQIRIPQKGQNKDQLHSIKKTLNSSKMNKTANEQVKHSQGGDTYETIASQENQNKEETTEEPTVQIYNEENNNQIANGEVKVE